MLGLSLIAVDQHDLGRAHDLLVESLKTSQRLGNVHRVAQSLERVAAVAARQGVPAAAEQFVGAADAIRERIMAPLGPVEERLLRERVGRVAATGSYAEGRRWPVERAVREALAHLEDVLPVTDASPLTARELEVAELVAQGMTNREIAHSLTIAERTATSHIEHVLNKLGFHSRSQIAVWVTAQRRPGGRGQLPD
jgi:DNA-binding CsgD family transcriptional regulator